MASPSPALLLPARRMARRYARVWAALPAVSGEVTGNGCYAVSRAGRRRWTSLPEIVADDAFVRARFAPSERSLVPDEHFVFAFPDGPGLVGVLVRWRAGNRELAHRRRRRRPASAAVALAADARRATLGVVRSARVPRRLHRGAPAPDARTGLGHDPAPRGPARTSVGTASQRDRGDRDPQQRRRDRTLPGAAGRCPEAGAPSDRRRRQCIHRRHGRDRLHI